MLLSTVSVPPELDALAGLDILAVWSELSPPLKRTVTRALADLVLAPATRRGRFVDPTRLDPSRWIGDTKTWGQLRTPASNVLPCDHR